MLAIGQVIGAAVGLGTHTIESTAYVPLTPTGIKLIHRSWRIPIAINLVWVVLIAGALFIIPESRRSFVRNCGVG
jgi:SP family sugar:H+ symporter-like MFS transporter